MKPAPKSPSQFVAVAITLLFCLSACTASDENSSQAETILYPGSLFFLGEEEGDKWCHLLPGMIPDSGFMPDGIEYEVRGTNINCRAGKKVDGAHYDLDVNVYGQWQESQEPASNIYKSMINQADSVPVDGIGSEAALVSIDTVQKSFSNAVGAQLAGVALLVLEGNLVLEFEAYSYTDLGAPRLHLVDLETTAATAIGTAEAYLTELGTENHTAKAPEEDAAVGVSSLPDLCSSLDLARLDLSVDQSDWVEDSEVMDRCHWQGGDTDLWLSAEAVGPLSMAGLSAEGFAAWWTGIFATTGGESLNLGDESYVVSLDPDTDDIEAPATDFVVRIGNVVLQGRYSDGTGDSRSAAEELAAAITEQVQALLAGS